MSDPIYPKRVWDAGIQQASVPANINSLRDEALSVASLGVANDESSPADGDVWIVGSAPTGAFSAFDEHDIALFRGGWHAWAPVANVRKVVNDVAKVFDGTEWVDDPAAGGGGGGSGIVESIVAGTGISVDDTDPANPIVSATGGGSGDVVGPSSSVDNTLPRFDGTGGKTLQGSGVAVSDNNEISGYRGHLNAQTGTTYTLQASDSGKVVECTNGSAITLTLPNSLPVGFCCTVVQGGAGAVTFSAASGATLRNRQSHTKTAGQWAGATLYVRTNSGGSSAEYVLCGDTAA